MSDTQPTLSRREQVRRILDERPDDLKALLKALGFDIDHMREIVLQKAYESVDREPSRPKGNKTSVNVQLAK
jgi:hypothetical protein